MSKLTPDQLEELQKSDPAAFDLDTAPVAEAKDAAKDDTKDDKPRDEQGRFKAADDAKPDEAKPDDAKQDETKDAKAEDGKADEAKKDDEPGIPQARLDEVIAQRNEARREAEALRARIAEQEAALAKANTPDHDARITEINAKLEELDQKYDEGDVDFKEYQKQHAQLVADRTRAEIGAEQTKKAAEEAAKKVEDAQKSAQEQWAEAQQRYFGQDANKEYGTDPVLVAAMEGAVRKVFADGDFKTYDEALTKARELVDARMGKAKPDPHAQRNKADAAAASKASAAPPAINGGTGNRGTEAGVVDLKQLKPGKFSSLPKAEQEKLLGEGAL